MIDFELDSDSDLDIITRNNVALGVGYKYKDRYSVELRYETPREVLSHYVYWDADYQTFSLIFGYSIF